MNNNQDKISVNPQMNDFNINNSTPNMIPNNQNGSIQNQQETLNVIPQMNPQPMMQQPIQDNIQNMNFNQDNNLNNQNNTFLNNNINTNIGNNINNIPNNNQMYTNTPNNTLLDNESIPSFQDNNRFINNVQNNTMLNDLNVDGEYNGMPKVDYSKDPKVVKNIQSEKKKIQ